MRVALVHYWLVSMRGGDKVLETLCELFPDADVYTNVYYPPNISPIINRHKIYTTYIQHLPFSKSKYQYYLPFMPHALNQLYLDDYDLVISSESGPAKGIRISPSASHVCYCHTPMRYIWDMYENYIEHANYLKKVLAPVVLNRLRKWDIESAKKVDYIVANSEYVSKRINKYWGRDSTVIYPPVETKRFYISNSIEDYYLIVGQHVPYKRTDIAIDAFNQNGRKLMIIGTGSEITKLKKLSKSNITFLGWQPDDVIRDYYSKCKALIFPGIEDFGMVPVEAMASGRPVIALRKGGAIETIVDAVTGVFFDDQTPDSLNNAISYFEQNIKKFDSIYIKKHAEIFDKRNFVAKIKDYFANLELNI